MSEIIVSGMRPTGALHLGHYVGVIKNWAQLQQRYQCFFFLADWHALTSCYEQTQVIKESCLAYIKGWLACGINPAQVCFYKQSAIPEILNLNQFFLSLTPPGWADRSPSWKDLKINPQRKLDNLGFYTYPILQAADIAMMKGQWVPVGEDQLTHLEISREIIRKFNRTYDGNLPEPQALLTKVPKLLGLDGNKMSSSIGNVITLTETEKSLQKKINKMKTDDTRGGIEFAGHPENCSVFDYHKIFSSEQVCQEIDQACRGASLGCGECKQRLGTVMKQELMPIAEKIGQIVESDCLDVLQQGNKKVRSIAKDHWDDLAKKVGFIC